MKKSVVILIALIYVSAIALVSFYGLKPTAYEDKVYVSDIKITNPDLIPDEKRGDYVLLYPNANGEFIYKIQYVVLPENATNKDVEFKADNEANYVSVSQDGTVVFDTEKMPAGGAAITVSIYAKDAPGVSASVNIYALPY